MSYYFLVLTSPDKKFHNVEQLNDYLATKYEQYAIISEMGNNGDNPHLNVIIKDCKRIDNAKRAIMNVYYGTDLERFLDNGSFKKHGACGKVVATELQYIHICVYLTKEGEPDYYFHKGLDLWLACKDQPTWTEHKHIQNESSHSNFCLDKLLDMAIQIYYTEYLKGTLNTLLPLSEAPPPTRHDLTNVLKIMTKQKINCMPIYNKLQSFFIQFMAQLGNTDYIEELIERQHEKLTFQKN